MFSRQRCRVNHSKSIWNLIGGSGIEISGVVKVRKMMPGTELISICALHFCTFPKSLLQFYYKQLKSRPPPGPASPRQLCRPSWMEFHSAPAFLFICNCNDNVAIVIRLVLVFIQVWASESFGFSSCCCSCCYCCRCHCGFFFFVLARFFCFWMRFKLLTHTFWMGKLQSAKSITKTLCVRRSVCPDGIEGGKDSLVKWRTDIEDNTAWHWLNQVFSLSLCLFSPWLFPLHLQPAFSTSCQSALKSQNSREKRWQLTLEIKFYKR